MSNEYIKLSFEIEIHPACKLYMFLYVRRSADTTTVRLFLSALQVALHFMPAFLFYLQKWNSYLLTKDPATIYVTLNSLAKLSYTGTP